MRDPRFRYFFLLLLATFCPLLFAATVRAQVKYNPLDDEVYAIANKSFEYLNSQPRLKENDALMSALAVIEFSKRYENEIPIDHRIVQQALKEAEHYIESETFTKDSAVYVLSLRIILLCESGRDGDKQRAAVLVKELLQRQKLEGGWTYKNESDKESDTSQTQYAALALWIAKKHKLGVYPESAERTLTWLCETISEKGSWHYHLTNRKPSVPEAHRHSLHCSGLSTIYLLTDYLQLSPRQSGVRSQALAELRLPPSVSIHRPPVETEPLVKFSRPMLQKTSRRGIKWLKDNWTVKTPIWNLYYLYALERYAYFRESIDGEISETPTWYDEGVDYLKSIQTEEGILMPQGDSDRVISTCFGIMFLVRASEILAGNHATGELVGNTFLPESGKIRIEKGRVAGLNPIENVQDMMTILEDSDTSESDVEFLYESMAKVLGEMSDSSDSQHTAVMLRLIRDRNPTKRKIAVRLLASQQRLESVPALLYALTDPELEICQEAHNGLRFVSRAVDRFNIPENPSRADFAIIKNKWTAWYLGINPGAELLE